MILSLLAALAVVESGAEPAACPRIERDPVARFADLPRIIRDWEGPMAEPGEDFNASDVIRAGDTRALARFMAGGDMGGGYWLVIHESGGRTLFRHVDVWRIIPDGALEHPVSLTGPDLDRLCAEAATKLDR